MSLRHRFCAAAVLVIALALAALPIIGCSGGVDGQRLVKSECARCHELDRIENSSNVTQEEWAQTVAIMEAHGLQVTTEERAAIINYLVEQTAAE